MRNKRKISKLKMILIFGIILYVGYILTGQQRILYEKESEARQYREKLKKEEQIAESLKKQKDMVGSDMYIEKIAREKLGMVKPGEKIFVDTNK